MRARSFAQIRSNNTVGELRCEPPLTLRQVFSDDDVCALCLVGSAAGPLAGDDLHLELSVHDHASARLTATGASIAQGRGGVPATMHLEACVGAHATLYADPGALVVAEGGRADVSVALTLAATATVYWRELVVLGRTTDATPGAATIRWDITRAGRPVLRQFLDLADALVRTHRVLATAFVTSPGLVARTVVASPTAVAQKIDATTVLVTVLGDSAADVTDRLDALTSSSYQLLGS